MDAVGGGWGHRLFQIPLPPRTPRPLPRLKKVRSATALHISAPPAPTSKPCNLNPLPENLTANPKPSWKWRVSDLLIRGVAGSAPWRSLCEDIHICQLEPEVVCSTRHPLKSTLKRVMGSTAVCCRRCGHPEPVLGTLMRIQEPSALCAKVRV